MPTQIKITPPGGTQQEIKIYEACQTNLSATDRAGSFSLTLPAFDNSIIDAFPVGSDVQIIQDENVFRGWVVKPPKALNGKIKVLNLEGATYTAKAQKIIVTESYIDTAIDQIVIDLFTKYAPWATVSNVQPCSKVVTISFADSYLWDAMEQLCSISTYDWYIDEDLDVNFFTGASRVNSTVLSQAGHNFKKGTASFTPDASKLVNRLWVKGGKALSDPYTQNITVTENTPIQLYYTPRAGGEGITVTIGGVPKTVGIQNIDDTGTKDFLLNAAEKLLIPDLCTSGSGTIVYRYEYPIKILLEDLESQAKYGLFEDIYNVDTNDKTLAKELGLQYLAKYSNPVITGSIEPMHGIYKPGELIKIEIPDININDYLQIKSVTYESVPVQSRVNRKLQLESPERDAASILKNLNKRLAKLEKAVYNDEDGPVEKYTYFADSVVTPALVDGGLTWHTHRYLTCGTVVSCTNLTI